MAKCGACDNSDPETNVSLCEEYWEIIRQALIYVGNTHPDHITRKDARDVILNHAIGNN